MPPESCCRGEVIAKHHPAIGAGSPRLGHSLCVAEVLVQQLWDVLQSHCWGDTSRSPVSAPLQLLNDSHGVFPPESATTGVTITPCCGCCYCSQNNHRHEPDEPPVAECVRQELLCCCPRDGALTTGPSGSAHSKAAITMASGVIGSKPMAPCALGRARDSIAQPALLLPDLEEQEWDGGRGSGHQHPHWSRASSPAQTAAAATGGWERAPPPLSTQLEPLQDSAAVGGVWTAHRAPSTSLGHAKQQSRVQQRAESCCSHPGAAVGLPHGLRVHKGRPEVLPQSSTDITCVHTGVLGCQSDM